MQECFKWKGFRFHVVAYIMTYDKSLKNMDSFEGKQHGSWDRSVIHAFYLLDESVRTFIFINKWKKGNTEKAKKTHKNIQLSEKTNSFYAKREKQI